MCSVNVEATTPSRTVMRSEATEARRRRARVAGHRAKFDVRMTTHATTFEAGSGLLGK